MSTVEPRLRAIGVHKSYGEEVALDDVDLEIAPGEVLALIGRNGAGKTTFFSIVAGLLRADAGSVRVEGIDVAEHPHRARLRLGLAGQETAVYPPLTVADNLRLFGELGGLRGPERRRRVAEAAELLDIADLLDRRARDLSSGQARRLHTAMALVLRPPLVLLDEPTAGVDVATRQRMLETVRGLAEEGAAICYSTHYIAEAEQLGGSVAVLERGRVLARGSVGSLIETHCRAVVELRFDGIPPTLNGGFESETSGQRLRVFAGESPGLTLARVLGQLGPAGERLRAVELIRPSLEGVFLDLTRSRD